MEDIEGVSPEYMQGFNKGYFIQQHRPELGETIISGMDSNADFALGFMDGGDQYIAEEKGKTLDIYVEPERNRGLDMDRD